MRSFGDFLRDRAGAAAVEFVLWIAVLTVPLLNAVDLGVYAFQRMQVQTAAQAAVQYVWQTCNSTAKLPAVKNCDSANLLANMRTAAQSTSLGTQVTIASGFPLEGYYCATSGGALTLSGAEATVGGTPTGGSTACTGTTTLPGDYIRVTTSYTYTPVFSGLSVTSLLATPIRQTAWMRLN